ncbi:MAG: lipopolysaccharide biosynthesis protein [Methanococcaceae archaeon]
MMIKLKAIGKDINLITSFINSKVRPTDFSRDVLILLTGTSIAQLIPVIITPIITRLFAPGDLGILTTFISITTLWGAFVNTRYDLAILQPEKDEDALNITVLSISLTVILTAVISFLLIFFSSYLTAYTSIFDAKYFLFIFPLTVILAGASQALRYFNIRIKAFKDISKSNINKSIGLGVSNISLGVLQLGANGLVISQILSNLAGNSILFYNIKKRFTAEQISFESIKSAARKYINFPKYTMAGEILYSFNQNMINLFILNYFNSIILGNYSLVMRLLGFPMQLIGLSIGDVFFQRIMEEKKITGFAKNCFNVTFKKLLFISLLIFPLIYLFMEFYFTPLFGSNWQEASSIGQIILFSVSIRFIVSPLAKIVFAFEKQKINLLWQLSMTLTMLISFYVTFLLKLDIKTFIIFITIVLIINDLLLLFISWLISRNKL